MAIVFLADIEGVASNLDTAYVQDLSIYGAGNPDRDDLAVYLLLFKRAADSTDTAITILNDAPLTASQWPFALPAQDGVFVGLLYGFQIWSAGVYGALDCVYYNGSLYIASIATSQTPGFGSNWVLITDIQTTATGNTSVEQTQVYMFSAARAEAGQLGDALADLGNKIRQGKCKSVDEAAAVITGSALIESSFVNFRRGDYENAQAIMDYVDATSSLTI